MRVCVLNEDQAWYVEREGSMPDHGTHKHWNRAKAVRELTAERVRSAWRNKIHVEDVVVLKPMLLPAKTGETIYWTRVVKESDGYTVAQFIPGQKRKQL